MKKTIYTFRILAIIALLSVCNICNAQRAKYVFYLISDGTGVNTLLGTEMMQAELNRHIGRNPLTLSQFPVVGVASTYSYNYGITDSAASGTALATGKKTKNGMIGETHDSISCNSIAVWAKESGAKVGIATSVCINHATPAAFYAHSHSRKNYYDIGKDLCESDFDFFGGSDFHKPNSSTKKNLYELAKDNDYVISRGYEEFVKNTTKSNKLILFQPKVYSDIDSYSLPYYIDRQEDCMTIPQIMKAQLEFLSKDAPNGFLLVNEIGGKVDFACHNNDGATAFKEVMAVDSCIRIAMDFYRQYPDETLIVFTSDHETGGLVLGSPKGGNKLNLKILDNQKCSQDKLTKCFQNLRSKTSNNASWEQVKRILSDQLGFWEHVNINKEEEKKLKDIYTRSFEGKMPNENNLYSSSEPIAAEAIRIINRKAFLSWGTGGHSAGLVPVYACGVGAELFMGHNDNADIPLKIAKAAGYKHD